MNIVKLISDNIWIGLVLWHRLDVYNQKNKCAWVGIHQWLWKVHKGRKFDSSEFDSTGVKLYIFIHNEVRDFDKNSSQPNPRVNCNLFRGLWLVHFNILKLKIRHNNLLYSFSSLLSFIFQIISFNRSYCGKNGLYYDYWF
jgi:hypothetical protein